LKLDKGRADFKWITLPWGAYQSFGEFFPSLSEKPKWTFSRIILPEAFGAEMHSGQLALPFTWGQFSGGSRILSQNNLRSIDTDGQENGKYSNFDYEVYFQSAYQKQNWHLYLQANYLNANLASYESNTFWLNGGLQYFINQIWVSSLQLKQIGAGSALIAREIQLPLQIIFGQSVKIPMREILKTTSTINLVYQNDRDFFMQSEVEFEWIENYAVKLFGEYPNLNWGLGAAAHLSYIGVGYLFSYGELASQHQFTLSFEF
jgi:hypothetical protein